MNGIARCTRYAFGPNRLHLCGPDANSEIAAYMSEGVTDQGLTGMLEKFRTLYPYLESISRANNIKDPFDERVVEAYWIGNRLLERIPAKNYHKHLVDRIGYKKRVPLKAFLGIEEKLKAGARMHHNVHVFNLYKRTGNVEVPHNLDSMDKCRVSWAQIMSIDGPVVTLKRQPLVLGQNRMKLGDAVEMKMKRTLSDDDPISDANVGDIVSMHWDEPCEILDDRQLQNLKLYTKHSLALANDRFM